MKNRILSIVLIIAMFLTMAVPSMTVSSATTSTPALKVTSQLLDRQSQYRLGDAAVLRYNFTPSGSIVSASRPPVDTVLVLDVSNSMKDKLSVLKASALEFVKYMKANRVAGDKITLITFHTYASTERVYSDATYSGLETAINQLTIGGYEDHAGGTNYEDALVTARMHFKSVSDSNSVVFFSDGVPTFYNVNARYYQHKNVWYRQPDSWWNIGGNGIDSSWYTLNEAQAEAERLKNVSEIYTISLGNDDTQHNVMRNIASESSNALISPGTDELTAAFKKIAQKVTAKELTQIKVRGSVPSGMTLNESSIPQGYGLTWIDSSTYEISVPNVTFPVDGGTPAPFYLDLSFTINSEGSKTFGGGNGSYLDIDEVTRSMTISGVQIYVSATENLSISITSSFVNDQSNYKVGESGALKYTVTPSGGVKGTTRAPADTVLVLDVSNSMADKPYNNYYPLSKLKSSAKAFVQHLKANGVPGDQITLISFHTYASKETVYSYPDFTGLETAIDELKASWSSPGGGTNYEDALDTAKMHFKNDSESNSVVFFSDGVPTYYDMDERYEWRQDWDGVDKWVRLPDSEVSIGGGGSWSDDNSKNQAQLAANDLKAKAKIYTISLGKDSSQTKIMKTLASDQDSALVSSEINELTSAFKKIAEKVTAKSFTNVKIRGNVPSGITVNASALPSGYSLVWINGTTYELSVPDVVFPADGSTPSPFSVELPFTVNSEGSKTLGDGQGTYLNSFGNPKSLAVAGVILNAYQVTPPKFTATPTTPTNQSVKVNISYPGVTTERYYKIVAKGQNPEEVAYIKVTASAIDITVDTNETRLYAYSVNKTYKSPVESYTVTNIDKVPPAAPIITQGAPIFNGGAVTAEISISYSPDSVIKEYRIGNEGEWLTYTGKITVSQNGTLIQARSKDAAGNVSPTTSYTVQELIHSVTKTSIASLTNSNRVLVVQNGSFVSLITFQTTEKEASQIQVILKMDKQSDLFNKMILPNSVIGTDAQGNSVSFEVTKNMATGEIKFISESAVSSGEKNFTMKLLVKVNRSAVGNYPIQIDGTDGPTLMVDVVKNPPIK